MNKRKLRLLIIPFLLCCLCSCYHSHPSTPLAKAGKGTPSQVKYSERQIDSLTFFSVHHYTNNYNFVVRGDSLTLIKQLPDEWLNGMKTDSFRIYKGDHVVVADIRVIPADTVDSVWVQLANDTSAFGWTREGAMLEKVMPDDPISKFISNFSNSHVIIFLVLVVAFAASYIVWSLMKRKARMVHVNDIDSFFPTLLCLTVSASATLYASLQAFNPQMWVHFYFHPTLNPFSLPLPLCVFLLSVWAIIIIAIAALDDIFRQLPVGEALLYTGGLASVCAIDYLVFSITTLYYVGYALLVAYFVLAIWLYNRKANPHFVCGNCGAKLTKKGRCPNCGAWNE